MKPDSINGAAHCSWRDQATVKLVGRRRESLIRLAERESPGCSPVDAIDRAIDVAMAARTEMDALQARLDSIEDTLEAMDSQRRAEWANAEASMAAIAKSLAGLHALIKRAAAGEDPL